jgi:hypothetical protein
MWYDPTGFLWMMGGLAYDIDSTFDSINDVWRYEITTGHWTWMSGDNVVRQAGVYGTQGVRDVNNKPGARAPGDIWPLANGEVWVFGGDA